MILKECQMRQDTITETKPVLESFTFRQLVRRLREDEIQRRYGINRENVVHDLTDTQKKQKYYEEVKGFEPLYESDEWFSNDT